MMYGAYNVKSHEIIEVKIYMSIYSTETAVSFSGGIILLLSAEHKMEGQVKT